MVLRGAVGGIMLAHGLQKLKGAFDGPGLEGTEKMTENIGLHPPAVAARAVALSETLGGGLTAAGFMNPLGPAMIIGTMAVAVYKVHMKNGFWNSKGGYEFNALLAASSFALAAQGPGPFSLDGILRKQRSGPHWGLLATALGLGAAAGVIKLGESMAPSSSASQDSTKDLGLDVPSSESVAMSEEDSTIDMSAQAALDEPAYQHNS
jgi:putative oxidoreductase